jgi:hypothetical protein
MAAIMWRRIDGPGYDRCVLEPTQDGFRLAGTALVVADGTSWEIRYAVVADEQWRTRTVGAHVQGPGPDRRIALHGDGLGGWSTADAPIIDLYGAIDVDLAWTPATNTLPILRLGLAVGASSEVAVAYVDFPGHEVARRTQRYSRHSDTLYRFESGDFTATLEIAENGLVERYEGLWDTVV